MGQPTATIRTTALATTVSDATAARVTLGRPDGPAYPSTVLEISC